jgi:hypothetical protein
VIDVCLAVCWQPFCHRATVVHVDIHTGHTTCFSVPGCLKFPRPKQRGCKTEVWQANTSCSTVKQEVPARIYESCFPSYASVLRTGKGMNLEIFFIEPFVCNIH